jgi:hypothetical protein
MLGFISSAYFEYLLAPILIRSLPIVVTSTSDSLASASML